MVMTMMNISPAGDEIQMKNKKYDAELINMFYLFLPQWKTKWPWVEYIWKVIASKAEQ